MSGYISISLAEFRKCIPLDRNWGSSPKDEWNMMEFLGIARIPGGVNILEQKQLSKYIETGAMSHMSIYSSHRSLIEIVTTILSDLKKYIQTYNKQGRINSTFFGFGYIASEVGLDKKMPGPP